MNDLPNGKKYRKLPENESILPERVKRCAKSARRLLRDWRIAMNDKTLTVTVVGRRCVYINDYRVAGSKPYVSENLPSWSFEADINDLRYAIGRRPSSANKALQSRIEALEAALREAYYEHG